MKALLLHEAGKWRDMEVHDIPKPEPNTNEVLVRIEAAGLNPVDYKVATNGHPEWTYPHILGVDGAGIVENVGSDVSEVQPGDRVVYHGNMIKQGNFAEFTVVPSHTVSVIPETVSFEDAVALPCAGYTAYQSLFRKMMLEAGQTILIHAGAGGVGGFAIQLAKYAGLHVITTASSENHEYVYQLGADEVIDYKEQDFVEKTLELTEGLGVHAVLDTVGPENATRSIETLAFNGHIAFIAGAPDITSNIDFKRALSFHQVALGGAHMVNNLHQQRDLARMGNEMLELLSEGHINSLVEDIISLEDVPEGLNRLASRHVRGKIVAKP
ncbi:zinc-binding dehydrogenase [Pontibacillus yanchengensis]|uniref:Zinc-binding alcohol dehydrogenase n=1 Tax=Pontibacillus yanchengensis Y32 TaxID=1385514 RepID=A0A0A2TCT0_9BACI|nr:zinc-binding dehydrogenase [Pontibacillus yanchengensis]KGP71851.1 zinc-binding alcohol dehydrogenase [Pontibacillus yanchengensis Y32]